MTVKDFPELQLVHFPLNTPPFREKKKQTKKNNINQPLRKMEAD